MFCKLNVDTCTVLLADLEMIFGIYYVFWHAMILLGGAWDVIVLGSVNQFRNMLKLLCCALNVQGVINIVEWQRHVILILDRNKESVMVEMAIMSFYCVSLCQGKGCTFQFNGKFP